MNLIIHPNRTNHQKHINHQNHPTQRIVFPWSRWSVHWIWMFEQQCSASLISDKGGVQIIKVEILRCFFHEGGGGSRVPHTYSEKLFFLKKTFRIIPWLWRHDLHLVWALYYVYIVVEVTLNMAKLLAVSGLFSHLFCFYILYFQGCRCPD